MKIESYTREWQGPDFGLSMLTEENVSCDLVEDLPVLRMWTSKGWMGEPEREIVHVTLTADAARKLAVQLLAAANGSDWQKGAKDLMSLGPLYGVVRAERVAAWEQGVVLETGEGMLRFNARGTEWPELPWKAEEEEKPPEFPPVYSTAGVASDLAVVQDPIPGLPRELE